MMEESNLMTVEYLRARLHAERSVSKAAKERADELAKRVEELEEQLEFVTLQRKRAEKATLDVLVVLESHGIGDIPGALYSGSEEDSLCELSVGKSDSRMEGKEGEGDGESSGKTQLEGDDKEEFSGSEHGSTPSFGRSLSWKSGKETHRSSEKKSFDSPLRRLKHFAQASSSSQRKRLGRSCRQIQRREIRSVVEEASHESTNVDPKDSEASGSPVCRADSLDSASEELKGDSEIWKGKVLVDDQISRKLEPLGPHHDFDREMERALERQAELIDRYEALERAQREWEEKYRESQNSTPDSCEPGNQSDVTEEKDEMRCSEIMYTAHNSGGQDPEKAADSSPKGASFLHFNSFKLSPDADLESSRDPRLDEMQTNRSPAPDFGFPVVNANQMHQDDSSGLQSHVEASTPIHRSHGRHTLASSVGSSGTFNAEATKNGCQNYDIVPHNRPQKLEQVLDSLQRVKLLLKQDNRSFPSTAGGSRGTALGPSASAMKDLKILRMPDNCAALYRVPTDFESEPPSQTRLLASDYSVSLPHQYPYSTVPLVDGDQHLPRAMVARPSASAIDRFYHSTTVAAAPAVSSRQQWSDFHSHMDRSMPSNSASSSYQHFVPRIPKHGTSSLYLNDHGRSNIYRY